MTRAFFLASPCQPDLERQAGGARVGAGSRRRRRARSAAHIQFELNRAFPLSAGSASLEFCPVRARAAGIVPVTTRATSQVLNVLREAGASRDFAVVQRRVPAFLLSVHGVHRLAPVVDDHSTTGDFANARKVREPSHGDG